MRMGFYLSLGVAVAGALCAATQPAGAERQKRNAVTRLAPAPGSTLPQDAILSALETLVETELPRRVAPADEWDAKISPEGVDLAAGRVGRLDVVGKNVRTRDDLTIAELGLVLQDFQVDLTRGAIKEVGSCRFAGRFREDAVMRYIRRSSTGERLMALRVLFRRDKMVVDAVVEASQFGIPVQVTGGPRLHATGVDFEADELAVARLRMPALVVDQLERQINPVVDLKGLHLPAKIDRVAIEKRMLVAEGTLDFSGPLLH